ncbi:MAG: MFS transporter, partial [Anaerolineales bacterium]
MPTPAIPRLSRRRADSESKSRGCPIAAQPPAEPRPPFALTELLQTAPTPILDRPPPRLRFQLAAFIVTRTVINTAYRMVYPFLPAIARGLGTDLRVAALAVTARSSLGLFGPLLGASADLRGKKTAMLGGLGVITSGILLITLWPTLTAFFLGMLMVGAGKIAFDSAMYAYLGDRVAYRRRGLAIAVVELGWSGAFLLGIPVAGWLMARRGWSGPFPWIALATLTCGLVLGRILPRD